MTSVIIEAPSADIDQIPSDAGSSSDARTWLVAMTLFGTIIRKIVNGRGHAKVVNLEEGRKLFMRCSFVFWYQVPVCPGIQYHALFLYAYLLLTI